MKHRVPWHLAAVVLAALLCVLPLAACGKAEEPTPTSAPAASSKSIATSVPTTAPTAPDAGIPSVSKDVLDETLDSYVLGIGFEVTEPDDEDMALDMEIQSQADPYQAIMTLVGTEDGEQQHLRIYTDNDLTAVLDLTDRQPEWEADGATSMMMAMYPASVGMTIDPMVEVCETTLEGTETVNGREALHYILDEDDLMAAMSDDDSDVTTVSASCDIWVDAEFDIVLKAEMEGAGEDEDDGEYYMHISWLVSQINEELMIAVPTVNATESEVVEPSVVEIASLEDQDSFQLETSVAIKTSDHSTVYYNAWHDWVADGNTRLVDLVFAEPAGNTNISVYGEGDDIWRRVDSGEFEAVDASLFDVVHEMGAWWLVEPLSLVRNLNGEATGVETVNGFSAVHYVADTSTLADHPEFSDAEPDGTLEYWVADEGEPVLLKVVMEAVATTDVYPEPVEISYTSEVVALDGLDSIDRPADLPAATVDVVPPARPTAVPTAGPVVPTRPTPRPVVSDAPEEFWIDDLVMPSDLDSYRLYQFIRDDSVEGGELYGEGIEEMDLARGLGHTATYVSDPDGRSWTEYIQTEDATWFDDGNGFETVRADIVADATSDTPWACSDWDSLTREPGTLTDVREYMGREAWRYRWDLEDFCGAGPVRAVMYVDAEMQTPLLITVFSTLEDRNFSYQYSVTDANQNVAIVSPDELPTDNALFVSKGTERDESMVGGRALWYKTLAMPYELLETRTSVYDEGMDTVLTAYDAEGWEVGYNDDGPIDYAAWMVYRPEHAGVIYLQAMGYDDETTGEFEFTHSTFRGSELSDGELLESGTYDGSITVDDAVWVELYGQVVYGIVGYVNLDEGDRIELTCLADTLGSALDPYVHIFDADGVEIVADDDSYGDGATLDSYLQYEAEYAGKYYVMVRSFDIVSADDDFFFELTVDINS